MSLEDLAAALGSDGSPAHLAAILGEAGRRVRAAREATPRIVRAEKLCPRCEEVKPSEAFGRNAARPDGLQSLCRVCR